MFLVYIYVVNYCINMYLRGVCFTCRARILIYSFVHKDLLTFREVTELVNLTIIVTFWGYLSFYLPKCHKKISSWQVTCMILVCERLETNISSLSWQKQTVSGWTASARHKSNIVFNFVMIYIRWPAVWFPAFLPRLKSSLKRLNFLSPRVSILSK